MSASNAPLRSGADVSWIPRCIPGDDQGNIGACTVFAIASVVEAVFGRPISNEACISAYHAERRRRYGGGDGGLYITEALFTSVNAGIAPRGTSVRRTASLDTLIFAPLVAVYRITSGWRDVSSSGCLDHSADTETGDLHAVALVSHGRIPLDLEIIWNENSWGQSWGYKGFCSMTRAYHLRHLDSLWQLIFPGQPASIAQYEAAQAARLAERLAVPVASIARNLQTLGYAMPADGAMIMADIVRRSMDGSLNPDQERAKSNLADVYLMLRGQGVGDADINAVAAYIAGARP